MQAFSFTSLVTKPFPRPVFDRLVPTSCFYILKNREDLETTGLGVRHKLCQPSEPTVAKETACTAIFSCIEASMLYTEANVAYVYPAQVAGSLPYTTQKHAIFNTSKIRCQPPHS